MTRPTLATDRTAPAFGQETCSLTIGRTARAAGVNVETVRYYQRRGLLQEPPKPLGGVRRYGVKSIQRILFIKRTQRLGFTLNEIGGLLALQDGRGCSEARDLAVAKLVLVMTRLTDLVRMRRALEDLVSRCKFSRGSITCPLAESLSGRDEAECAAARRSLRTGNPPPKDPK